MIYLLKTAIIILTPNLLHIIPEKPMANTDTKDAPAGQKDNLTDNPHDKGYKRIFSVKKNFIDFIKKYVGLEWMMELTENDLELVDKEFVTDQFDTYESDLVYKAHLNESDVYLFFLFELQSYNDFTMPFRLLIYMTAIWLDYFKNSDENERKKKGYRLPAVIPMVLYNGEFKWTASKQFRELIKSNELFGNYIADFEYILISLNELLQSKIKESNTLVDNILLADKNKTRQDWINTFPDLFTRVRAMKKSDMNDWITWFTNVVRKINEEERKKFIEQLEKGDTEGMSSSFERLLNSEKAEGKAEGKAEDIVELLEEVGELPDALKDLIMGQNDIEVLRRWVKAAARADSIEDFEEKTGLAVLSR